MAETNHAALDQSGAGQQTVTPASKKKTDAEKLAELKQKEAALKAQIAKFETKAKDEERKKDTRRKIIIGAAVMAHAKIHQDFAYKLSQVLMAAVTKDTDRELIKDFLK